MDSRERDERNKKGKKDRGERIDRSEKPEKDINKERINPEDEDIEKDRDINYAGADRGREGNPQKPDYERTEDMSNEEEFDEEEFEDESDEEDLK